MNNKIITSISFNNFYNYYGEYGDNEYIFKEGLNIIVADNGCGKSKLFNGFLWILKNLVYDSEKKKVDPIEKVSFTTISDMAKEQTDLQETVKIGVKLTYQDHEYEYQIEKFFYATRIYEGKALDVSCWEISPIEQYVSKKSIGLHLFETVYNMEEQDQIIRNIIQPDLQNYALLQGEEIDRIIDFSSSGSLDAAINKLTDINHIKELVSLSDYLSTRANKDLESQNKIHTRNKDVVEEKLTQKNEISSILEEEKTLIQKAKENLNHAKEEKDKLLNSITNTTKRDEVRSKINHLREKEKEVQNMYEQYLDNVNSYFFDSDHAWVLMGLDGEMKKFSNLYEEYSEKRLAKKILKEGGENIFVTSLPPNSPDYISLEKMIELERCFVCNREAKKNSEPWKYMKLVKDRPSIPNDLKNDLKDFFGDMHLSVQRHYKSIPGIKESIIEERSKGNTYKKKLSDIAKEIENLELELIQFGGINISGKTQEESDKKNLEVFAEANRRIGKYTIEIEESNKEIEELESKLKDIDESIADLRSADFPEEFVERAQVLADIKVMMTNTKKRVFTEILDRLDKNSNLHFQNLTAANTLNGGILKLRQTSDETATIEVIDEDGNLVTGQSEGFQRMKKLAVVMAVISSKYENGTFDYPLIADAPFSAFGKGFIEGFFKEVPKVFNQSIILVKELYDKDRDSHLSEVCDNMMRTNELSTLYLNEIEEGKSQARRKTKIHQYK